MNEDWSTTLTIHLTRVQGDSSVPTPSINWPAPFVAVSAQLRLSATEQMIIGLLVYAQLNTAFANSLSALSGSCVVDRGSLVAAAYSGRVEPALRELADSAPLFELGLLELERVEVGGSGAWNRRAVRVSERTLAVFHGIAEPDPSLSKILRIRQDVLPSTAVECDPALLTRAREAVRVRNVIVLAIGTPGVGRRTVLAAAALDEGVRVAEIDARNLSKDIVTLREEARRIACECRILRRAPLVMNADCLVQDRDHSRLDVIGDALASHFDGPILLTCANKLAMLRWRRPTVAIEMRSASTSQRTRSWLAELGQGTREDAEYLATQYPIAPALIHHAANAAKARANGRKMEPEDIYAGVRAVLDDKLGDYARRVEVTQTWDDLVLPEDQMEQVQYLIARIRQRRTVYEQWGFAAKVGKGLGTSALFSGPPGTGKTMVAALIAKELGLELYQVDMAKITSKYIGETERNLAALFDAAEAGHAILLFDEADSLFGKRTEVKSSNDRYANLETNYLLQRLESFTGICLLTSNHESNIDPAFQRRLSLHVRFELPEAEERAALWQATLPAAAPVAEGVDFMKLATKYEMSGGYIRNAALRAAFLAADEGSEITVAHLERAAKLEYEGMGKIAA